MTRHVQCAIAGGGPAGMMLGVLLARAGVSVLVLEKHADFLRDFRGDTVHPSTLQVMDELGWLDDFLKIPHEKIRKLAVTVGARDFNFANFGFLPERISFIAMVPQWDFLNFLAARGASYPGFHLEMNERVAGLIEEGGAVRGLRAETPQGPIDVRADLVVGADGRTSDVRQRAQMEIEDLGAPIDVFWMRVSRLASDPGSGGRIGGRLFLALIARGDYWQLAVVIPKGEADIIRARGIQAFRDDLRASASFLGDRVNELKSFDDLKLLTVRIDRLKQWWRRGLICIGDAAHAMSPVGGVGINLAIQDAVATANILAEPLREGRVTDDDLARVQLRREFPTRMIQRVQVAAQNNLIRPSIGGAAPAQAPLVMRVFNAVPMLQRLPARIFGLGIRPEHVAAEIRSARG
ncbi:MAG: FAD-dependent oxidoreductase [Hyphomicrobium sp.]